MSRITRARPSPAAVIATVALFVALGSAAVAERGGVAERDSVVATSIKKNAVKSRHISNKKGVRAKDIVEGAIRGKHLNFALRGGGDTANGLISTPIDTWVTVAADTFTLPGHRTMALVSGGIKIEDVADASPTVVDIRLLCGEGCYPSYPPSLEFSETILDGQTRTVGHPQTPIALPGIDPSVDPAERTFSLQVRVDSPALVTDRALSVALLPCEDSPTPSCEGAGD